MRLINVETLKFEEFFGGVVPPYAILSHTWGNDNEELSFRDVEDRKFKKAGIRLVKLEGCCMQAQKDRLRYAWIDTCCIDKTNAVELGEAINSMFQWYKNASICYAYLSDVPADDNPRNPRSKFLSSRWFERGWTLQELLAPKKLCFYNSEWRYLGTKREMSAIIEKITGIPRLFLVGVADLHDASVAQRMSWAAKRVTKRREDIAYCLLGIFGVMMPMIYGEGDQAFSRLQQEIMKDVRDDSILAWGLNLTKSTQTNSTEVISGGVLAAAPSDFVNCEHIVSREQYTTPTNSFDIFGGSLRIHLPLFTTSAGEIFGLLRCGPGHNIEEVVGIPLNTTVPGGPSDEYIRPQGHCSFLLPKATSEISTKFIHIQNERQGRMLTAMNRQYWFYVEESLETNLELIDVEPPGRWQKENAMIVTEAESDGNAIQRSLARFRHKEEGSRDFVVVLEFEVQRSQIQTRYHVMISSRDTALENVAQHFDHLRQEALGKQSASNGILNLHVTLRQEFVARQPMFVVRLAAISSLPEVTVDVTSELQLLDLKLALASVLGEEEKIRLEAKGLGQQRQGKMADLKEQLEGVEEKLRKLSEERRLLLDGLEKESQEMKQLSMRVNDVGEQRYQTQLRLCDFLRSYFDGKEAPEYVYKAITNMLDREDVNTDSTADGGTTLLLWAAEKGDDAVVMLLLASGDVDTEMKNILGQTSLLCAAMNGHKAVVELLLKNGADMESKDQLGATPLSLAAIKGHRAVVELLLKNGADMESKDKGGATPLLRAVIKGHQAVVELLLKNGVELEAQDPGGMTPLLWAAAEGHQAVVELLLKNGAQIESKDEYGQTPLSWAATNLHKEVAKLLLEAGAVLKTVDEDVRKLLLRAAVNRNIAVAVLLLEVAVDLESKDVYGQTLLTWAARRGHEALVELLLENGAMLESKDIEGQTPLMLAAANGQKAIVALLLKAGAELESEDKYGRTPLSLAAVGGQEAILEQLIKAGAVLESRDNWKLTPLMLAAANDNHAIVELLLKNGAELEAKNSNGQTPLSCAAAVGDEEMVELLLENGAELESKDNQNNTPLMWALANGHKEAVVELLLKKSKDRYPNLKVAGRR